MDCVLIRHKAKPRLQIGCVHTIGHVGIVDIAEVVEAMEAEASAARR